MRVQIRAKRTACNKKIIGFYRNNRANRYPFSASAVYIYLYYFPLIQFYLIAMYRTPPFISFTMKKIHYPSKYLRKPACHRIYARFQSLRIMSNCGRFMLNYYKVVVAFRHIVIHRFCPQATVQPQEHVFHSVLG